MFSQNHTIGLMLRCDFSGLSPFRPLGPSGLWWKYFTCYTGSCDSTYGGRNVVGLVNRAATVEKSTAIIGRLCYRQNSPCFSPLSSISFIIYISWLSFVCLTYQRKFRSSNFRLYWKLPVGLAASMFDSRDVLAGRNCAKCCVFP